MHVYSLSCSRVSRPGQKEKGHHRVTLTIVVTVGKPCTLYIESGLCAERTRKSRGVLRYIYPCILFPAPATAPPARLSRSGLPRTVAGTKVARRVGTKLALRVLTRGTHREYCSPHIHTGALSCVSALSLSPPRTTLVLAGTIISKRNSTQHKVPPAHRHTTRLASSCSHRKLSPVLTLRAARARTASYVSTSPLHSIFSSRRSQQVDARTTICNARPPRDYALNSPWLGDPIGRQGLVLLVARIGDHGRNRRRSAAAESFGLLRQLVCLPASPAFCSLACYLVTRSLPCSQRFGHVHERRQL